jgi:hypothetical protein
VLGSATTQGQGDSPAITRPQLGPVVTISSTGDVSRGETGLFFLRMSGGGGTYVNFSVSGTAIPGVDYVPLISPVYVYCIGNICGCCSGAGEIPVETLPDPRGSFIRRAYSVVVTVQPGLGYAVGEPSSAKMMINPSP